MIIVEGPDHTGKTTLAKKISERLSLKYYHFTKDSTYTDYLKLLCSLDSVNAVMDRWIFSEHPYSISMNRRFAFTLKQWHNIVLLTLAQNPIVILCTHMPNQSEYLDSQYLPYNKWAGCLRLYKEFFSGNRISYIEYNYSDGFEEPFIRALSILHSENNKKIEWWINMWKAGHGCIGSTHPKYLLVAERIGPNNVNNLPFETGPTGHMLSDMLDSVGTPLGEFAVTNMVKSFRRDSRPPNDNDTNLLMCELTHLKPEIVIFMGAVSQQSGIAVAKRLGIKTATMTHFGYFSHRGISDISVLCSQWAKITGKEVIIEKGTDRPIISFTTTSF